MKFFKKIKLKMVNIIGFFILYLPCICFADQDPVTSSMQKFYMLFFGTLAVTLCAITIGVTFLLAKVGKCSWDRFLWVGGCAAGFLGAPGFVLIIKSAVGNISL